MPPTSTVPGLSRRSPTGVQSSPRATTAKADDVDVHNLAATQFHDDEDAQRREADLCWTQKSHIQMALASFLRKVRPVMESPRGREGLTMYLRMVAVECLMPFESSQESCCAQHEVRPQGRSLHHKSIIKPALRFQRRSASRPPQHPHLRLFSRRSPLPGPPQPRPGEKDGSCKLSQR